MAAFQASREQSIAASQAKQRVFRSTHPQCARLPDITTYLEAEPVAEARDKGEVWLCVSLEG